jgi:hypothetical protein
VASTSREIDAFKSRPARKPDCVSPFEDDGVSDMSIYRWERDPKLNFPAPIRVARRRYWKLSDLVRWEQAKLLIPPSRGTRARRAAAN